MIEAEHPEICQADLEEKIFLEHCRQLLLEYGLHPITRDELLRARPAAPRTHYLEYNPRTGEYTPVPIVPQYERGA
jgi:hypothetical protein